MCKFDKRTRQHRNNKNIDMSSIDWSTRGNQSKGVPVGTFDDSKEKRRSPQTVYPMKRRNALANLRRSPKDIQLEREIQLSNSKSVFKTKRGFNQI